MGLTEEGETVDHLYHRGTQIEMEEALQGWLLREKVSNPNKPLTAQI
jgi:hypothetical protein